MRYALWVSLSTIAATSTLSLMTSPHLSNARFVVMMVDLRSALSERWLKSNSPASLSHETYPNSSQTTRSYFLNLSSSWCSVLLDLHSLICVYKIWSLSNRYHLEWQHWYHFVDTTNYHSTKEWKSLDFVENACNLSCIFWNILLNFVMRIRTNVFRRYRKSIKILEKH